jgi:PAS domain S-box-containing protein
MTMRQDGRQDTPGYEQADKERSRFFALSLDMLCIAGFDGYFKHLNPAWEKTLGFANEELLSKPYLAFVHPEDQASTIAEAQKLSAGGVTITFQNRYLCQDGSYRWLSWAATPLKDQQLIYAAARDITERKRTEKRLTAQYAVTRVLAESATLAEATPNILQAVCDSVEWELGLIWSVDKQANLLRCIDMWHAPTVDVAEFKAVSRVMTFPLGIGLPGRVWASGEPAWIPDVMKDANFPRVPFAKTTGLHGAFGFPILFGGEVTGVSEFFSREIREPDDDLVKMMSALGSQIGQFIARKQGDHERERLIGELKAALANIKTLRGLLPICATCNKIRDDKGSWNRLEEYISARSEAAFTHGICTECARKLHPEWDEA